jgi:hypothetical protein
MSPTIKKTLVKGGEYVGLFAAFGIIGSLWINTEVERRMDELATDPALSPVVVTLQAEVANIEASQIRIEAKVDAFSASFMAYLQRQTE